MRYEILTPKWHVFASDFPIHVGEILYVEQEEGPCLRLRVKDVQHYIQGYDLINKRIVLKCELENES